MHQVYLIIGSNIGDRRAFLEKAHALISTGIGRIAQASQIYETEAWGIEDQEAFLNQVIRVESAYTPEDILEKVQDIEVHLGRMKTKKWGARVIDIDILFYDDVILETKKLTIPHPEFHKRNFAIVPLMELAPDKTHPKLGITIAELYLQSHDAKEVAILEANEAR